MQGFPQHNAICYACHRRLRLLPESHRYGGCPVHPDSRPAAFAANDRVFDSPVILVRLAYTARAILLQSRGMSSKPKYYLFVDETGQHTQGQMFVVAVACFDATEAEALAGTLLSSEATTKKGQRKWVRTSVVVRQAYLKDVMTLCQRTGLRFYYRVYGDGTDYINRTSEAVVAAIQANQPESEASLVIVIDGLNPEERQRVSRSLRRHTLPYSRTVRGGRDESTPFIRLVDALAGYVRHAHCDEPYTKPLWQQLRPYLHKV